MPARRVANDVAPGGLIIQGQRVRNLVAALNDAL